jgi:NADH-ubiquinone oxidoreductase chain 4
MPLLSFFFFIFILSNSGVPLSLNFIGEFLSLYGFFEKLPILGIFASLSIIFSSAYNLFLYNRITYGSILYHNSSIRSVVDVYKLETYILSILLIFTISLGIYPGLCTKFLDINIINLIYTSSTI